MPSPSTPTSRWPEGEMNAVNGGMATQISHMARIVIFDRGFFALS
jgi:hypothetical protein